MKDLSATVSLALPADPESIALVRVVVAGVASKLAVPYDSVDDLRIAAAEAATMLLTSSRDGSRLRVDLEPSDDDLRLTIWVEGTAATPALGDRESLAWKVIEGLADEHRLTEVEGSPAIELSVRTVDR